jgi:uncharacterized membrane protein
MIARTVICAAMACAGCGHWTELSEVSCPPAGTKLGYTSFAAGFMDQHCNSCHSAPDGDRKGAPLGVVLDNYQGLYNLRERVFLRAAADNTTMPPGPDDPPAASREQLAEWIACGAPR